MRSMNKNPSLKRRPTMKLGFQSALFPTIVLLGGITCLTGCVTIGLDEATKDTDSVEIVENDFQQASVQIDSTRASLEDLIRPDQTDIKKAYDAYVENAKQMGELGKQLDMQTGKISARGCEYFAEWKFSGTNFENQELSELRLIKMCEGYAKLREASIGMKGGLKSYLMDIREIQKYLPNGLTTHKIEAIRPIAQMAVKDGDSLQETVKQVLTTIDRVKTEMAQDEISTVCSTDCELR